MIEDLKKGCATAILAAMWEAYYGHQNEELLEKVILKNLDFLVREVQQQK